MNSVTQTKVKYISLKKEDSAKELLALICCVLFVLFCVFSIVDCFPDENTCNKSLQVSSDQYLVFNPFSEKFSPKNQLLNFSPETLNLTPFFFLPIAINYCDKSLLMSVRGIGPGLAGKILETRKRIGTFSTPEDLLLVHGIGPVRLSKLKPYLSFIVYHD